MYFDNITNRELQYFHDLKVPNFSIKLSDVLSSGLFKKETIIEDSLYRVYPLFYCNEITSTNPEDKILDNKCIICIKQDTETYLSFISDSGSVQDYVAGASYFDVGATLTEGEYNQIVSLLRSNVIMNDPIKINEEYNGIYGKYLFNIDDTTILDTGIVITDETISAQPKVKLTDNVFNYSNYTLKLSVLHFTSANIQGNDNDYKVIETMEILLIPNEWVNIPVESLDEDYIICLDANVEITHNKPVIPNWITEINLTATPNIIQTGDNSEFYALGLDNGGLPVGAGHTIYFFEKIEPTLTMSASPSIVQTGDNAELYCTVKDDDGSLVEGITTHFYIVPNSDGVLINDPTEYTASDGREVLFELTDLGDNWELSCDFKTTCESKFLIGAKDTFTGNPNNSIFVGSPKGTNKMYYGYRDVTTHSTNINGADPTSYSRMKIARNNNRFTFTVNGNTYSLSDITVLDSFSDLVIGLIAWGSSVYVKNVKLKVIED